MLNIVLESFKDDDGEGKEENEQNRRRRLEHGASNLRGPDVIGASHASRISSKIAVSSDLSVDRPSRRQCRSTPFIGGWLL